MVQITIVCPYCESDDIVRQGKNKNEIKYTDAEIKNATKQNFN
jgi:transposase-like protein